MVVERSRVSSHHGKGPRFESRRRQYLFSSDANFFWEALTQKQQPISNERLGRHHKDPYRLRRKRRKFGQVRKDGDKTNGFNKAKQSKE